MLFLRQESWSLAEHLSDGNGSHRATHQVQQSYRVSSLRYQRCSYLTGPLHALKRVISLLRILRKATLDRDKKHCWQTEIYNHPITSAFSSFLFQFSMGHRMNPSKPITIRSYCFLDRTIDALHRPVSPVTSHLPPTLLPPSRLHVTTPHPTTQ